MRMSIARFFKISVANRAIDATIKVFQDNDVIAFGASTNDITIKFDGIGAMDFDVITSINIGGARKTIDISGWVDDDCNVHVASIWEYNPNEEFVKLGKMYWGSYTGWNGGAEK